MHDAEVRAGTDLCNYRALWSMGGVRKPLSVLTRLK